MSENNNGLGYVIADWKEIYARLKEKGHTLVAINALIGGEMKNHVYKGYSMKIEQFHKLQEIIDFEFDYEYTKKRSKYKYGKIELPRNEEIAELVGIMLGDGHIGAYVSIILNGIDEPEYFAHVREILKSYFPISPSVYDVKDSKAVQLRYYSKSVIGALLDIGLKQGKKVGNQVEVPQWVQENEQYTISCIRGLFDSDGSIYYRKVQGKKQYKYVNLSFKSRSLPLLDFFLEFCDNHQIKATKTEYFQVIVSRQEDIQKFVDMINSNKIQRFFKKNNIDKII